LTPREFETNFRLLYLPLGMYALRMVGDADTAEDMVQEAFMKAWEFIGAGGAISNFTPFMYRTVRNVCLRHLRDRRVTLGEELIPDVPDEDIDTSFRDAPHMARHRCPARKMPHDIPDEQARWHVERRNRRRPRHIGQELSRIR